MILRELFRVVSRFPRYFHVILRKVDYLWNSVEQVCAKCLAHQLKGKSQENEIEEEKSFLFPSI